MEFSFRMYDFLASSDSAKTAPEQALLWFSCTCRHGWSDLIQKSWKCQGELRSCPYRCMCAHLFARGVRRSHATGFDRVIEYESTKVRTSFASDGRIVSKFTSFLSLIDVYRYSIANAYIYLGVVCRIQLCCWKQNVFCYKALFCQVGPFRTLAEISQNNLPPWRSPRITMDNYGQLEWEVRMMPNSCCSGAPMLCALCTSWSANWLSTSSGAANRWFAWVNFPKCWFSRHQKRNLIWCNVHIMRFMVSYRNFPKVSACTVVNPRTRPACGAGAVLAKDQSFVSRLGNLLFNSQTTQTWVWLEKGASMDLQRTHKWFVIYIYIYLSESTIQKLKVRLQ